MLCLKEKTSDYLPPADRIQELPEEKEKLIFASLMLFGAMSAL